MNPTIIEYLRKNWNNLSSHFKSISISTKYLERMDETCETTHDVLFVSTTKQRQTWPILSITQTIRPPTHTYTVYRQYEWINRRDDPYNLPGSFHMMNALLLDMPNSITKTPELCVVYECGKVISLVQAIVRLYTNSSHILYTVILSFAHIWRRSKRDSGMAKVWTTTRFDRPLWICSTMIRIVLYICDMHTMLLLIIEVLVLSIITHQLGRFSTTISAFKSYIFRFSGRCKSSSILGLTALDISIQTRYTFKFRSPTINGTY